jgi:hypothetical protein
MRIFRSIPGRTAIILLVITILWTLIEHLLGFNTTKHEVGQYTRMITAFLYYFGIVVAIYRKRKHENNTLSIAEGFRTGLAVTVIYSFFVTLWFALYAEVINPQYKPTLLAYEKGKLIASGASAEKMASKLNEVEMSSGGSITSYIFLFAFMAVMGVIVSILAALILRRAGERQPHHP